MNDTSRFRRGLKTLWSGTPKTRVRISTVSRNLKALALMTRCGTLRRLVREGHIHNYMRMLWSKKIIEWSASPRAALSILIELNNKYGLDGRNPNSYSGIFWCLGRYDRPLGTGAPYIRDGSLHELGKYRAQVFGKKLHSKIHGRQTDDTNLSGSTRYLMDVSYAGL
jgi:hypothetical protein